MLPFRSCFFSYVWVVHFLLIQYNWINMAISGLLQCSRPVGSNTLKCVVNGVTGVQRRLRNTDTMLTENVASALRLNWSPQLLIASNWRLHGEILCNGCFHFHSRLLFIDSYFYFGSIYHFVYFVCLPAHCTAIIKVDSDATIFFAFSSCLVLGVDKEI